MMNSNINSHTANIYMLRQTLRALRGEDIYVVPENTFLSRVRDRFPWQSERMDRKVLRNVSRTQKKELVCNG